jgi:hypothetical protein
MTNSRRRNTHAAIGNLQAQLKGQGRPQGRGSRGGAAGAGATGHFLHQLCEVFAFFPYLQINN